MAEAGGNNFEAVYILWTEKNCLCWVTVAKILCLEVFLPKITVHYDNHQLDWTTEKGI